MKNLKRMSLGALLFAVTLPLYAQQEVDPTWYDPWAKPVAAHAVPVKAQDQAKDQGKVQKASEPAPQPVKAKKILRERNSQVTMRAEVVAPK